MELRVDVILYSKSGNENDNAGHVKYSRGPQVPHPSFNMISDVMFSDKFLMSDVLATNLILTGLLFLFSTLSFNFRMKKS